MGWFTVPLILAHGSRHQGLRYGIALASSRPSSNPGGRAAACRLPFGQLAWRVRGDLRWRA